MLALGYYFGWLAVALLSVIGGAEAFAYLVHYPAVLGPRFLGLIYTPTDFFGWMTRLVVHGPQLTWVESAVAGINVVNLFTWLVLYQVHKKKTTDSFGSAERLPTSALTKIKAFKPGLFVLGLSDDASYKVNYAAKEEVVPGHVKLGDQDVNRTVTTHEAAYTLKHPGKIIYSSENTHYLGIASSRSGKGISLVIPTLMNYPFSTVCYDLKKELWNATAAHRSSFADPIRFEPTALDTPRWNPMLEILPGVREVPDAMLLGEIIAGVDSEQGTSDYWVTSSARTIGALILYVLYHPKIEIKSLSAVYDILSDDDRESKLIEMSSFPTAGFTDQQKESIGHFSGIANQLLQMGPNELSGVMGTSIANLQLFSDPTVRRAVSKSDFTILSLVTERRPKSLYIVIPPGDAERLRPLTRIMFLFIGQKLTLTTVDQVAKRHKLLMLIDEFPSLGKMSFFEKQIAYFAGYGITLMLIIQSFNQLYRIYGERTAIPDNCKVKVILGVDTAKEAKEVSDYLGVSTVIRKSRGNSSNSKETFGGSSSINVSEGQRPLLHPDEILRMAFEEMILIQSRLAPYFGKKIMYYADKRFKVDPKLIRPDDPYVQKTHLARRDSPWLWTAQIPYNFELGQSPLSKIAENKFGDRKKQKGSSMEHFAPGGGDPAVAAGETTPSDSVANGAQAAIFGKIAQ